MTSDAKVYVAGAILLGLGVWYVQRQAAKLSGLIPTSPAGIQAAVGQSVNYLGNAIGAAGVGAVEGVGLAVGIPRTDMTQCARDKASGDWWAASFSCPAADFVGSGAGAAYAGLFGGSGVPAFESGGGGVYAGHGASGSW